MKLVSVLGPKKVVAEIWTVSLLVYYNLDESDIRYGDTDSHARLMSNGDHILFPFFSFTDE